MSTDIKTTVSQETIEKYEMYTREGLIQLIEELKQQLSSHEDSTSNVE